MELFFQQLFKIHETHLNFHWPLDVSSLHFSQSLFFYFLLLVESISIKQLIEESCLYPWLFG